jgi:signal transduction histidine kinase
VEAGKETYLVIADHVDDAGGTLIVSRDISVMESQEIYSTLTLLSVALVIALVSVVLSYVNARQLVRPLQRLTHRIHQTEPGKSMARLDTDYNDIEFVEIAQTFNRFLSELEAFVGREKSFVKLASHELRSPLAVIAGALEIIEKRDQLTEEDKHTLARVRRASQSMQADIEVRLKLARGEMEPGAREPVNVERSIQDTLADLRSTRPEQAERLHFEPGKNSVVVTTDPSLMRMLIRNLVHNALTHTRSTVQIELSTDGFRVSHSGAGLPQPVMERLSRPLARQPEAMQESSFGLLIVQLICERLKLARSDDTGTAIEIGFNPV